MQSLRRKIDGAGDLEGVVRAMKALAASSIGQYEKAVQSLDGYYRTVELGLSACLRQARRAQVTAAKTPKADAPVGAVIFGSDQGLVGRFNEVIVDLAVETLKKLPGPKKKIWAVGDRVHGLLVDAGLGAPSLLSVPSSINAITPLVGEILIEIEAAREQHDVVDVYLFHNHPESAGVFEPVCKRLLPLDQPWQNKLTKLPWPTKMLPQVIEGPDPYTGNLYPWLPVCPSLSGVCGVPQQRKRQPSGGDATRRKEHQEHARRFKPGVSPCSTGVDRRGAFRRCLRIRGIGGAQQARLEATYENQFRRLSR